MSGQLSEAIAVGDNTPINFTIDNSAVLLIVAFSFEDADGNVITPSAGSRTVTLRFRMSGYLPDGPTPYTQVRYEYREGSPASFEVPAKGTGTYNLGGLNSFIELSSVQTIATPGAVAYRYLISANPLGGTNGGG